MLSSTTTPLFYHYFPIFACDHSIALFLFCTHFAPFCTIFPILPVLQGPSGE